MPFILNQGRKKCWQHFRSTQALWLIMRKRNCLHACVSLHVHMHMCGCNCLKEELLSREHESKKRKKDEWRPYRLLLVSVPDSIQVNLGKRRRRLRERKREAVREEAEVTHIDCKQSTVSYPAGGSGFTVCKHKSVEPPKRAHFWDVVSEQVERQISAGYTMLTWM